MDCKGCRYQFKPEEQEMYCDTCKSNWPTGKCGICGDIMNKCVCQGELDETV